MQTVSRVEMDTHGTDELACSICKEEYSKQRGVDSYDQPGDDRPELPVKLFCRHIFEEWCTKTWLLQQPASCPACSFLFKPVDSQLPTNPPKKKSSCSLACHMRRSLQLKKLRSLPRVIKGLNPPSLTHPHGREGSGRCQIHSSSKLMAV